MTFLGREPNSPQQFLGTARAPLCLWDQDQNPAHDAWQAARAVTV